MGENGRVISKEEEMVTVSFIRNEACAKCKACMAGFKSEEMLLSARNLCGAEVDDWVEIELKSVNFMKAVGIMYGIPCIFFIAGIFLGTLVFDSELIGFIAGLMLVAVVYLLIRKGEGSIKKEDYAAEAVKIIENK